MQNDCANTATFSEIEQRINEQRQLRAAVLNLRAQLTEVRNKLAVNVTWLHANSPLVKGWRQQRASGKKS